MNQTDSTQISMHAGETPENIALMSAQSLPSQAASGEAPEWIHLLPAGEIATDDDRGPYRVADPAKVIKASFQHSEKLPVDINHSTHKLGALGHEAPAVGWVVEMQSREDGIWGRVEWSKRGAQMLADREYRGISPVIRHTSAKQILAITCASLTNNPNLRGMTALHQKETGMNFRDKLIEMLGLEATASDEEVMSALTAKLKGDADAPAMQSALGEIGVALGLAKDAKPADIVTAAQAATSSDDTAVTALQASNAALQSSVTALTTTVTSLQSGQVEAASEAFLETAIQERRAGVNPKVEDDIGRQKTKYLREIKGGEVHAYDQRRVRFAPDCQFFCHVVADIVGDLEDQLITWNPTANGEGRFRALEGVFKGSSIEVIQWTDLINDAWSRNMATLTVAGLRRGKPTVS